MTWNTHIFFGGLNCTYAYIFVRVINLAYTRISIVHKVLLHAKMGFLGVRTDGEKRRSPFYIKRNEGEIKHVLDTDGNENDHFWKELLVMMIFSCQAYLKFTFDNQKLTHEMYSKVFLGRSRNLLAPSFISFPPISSQFLITFFQFASLLFAFSALKEHTSFSKPEHNSI